MRVADDHVDEVLAHSDFLLKGIDGLYYYKNSLIESVGRLTNNALNMS